METMSAMGKPKDAYLIFRVNSKIQVNQENLKLSLLDSYGNNTFRMLKMFILFLMLDVVMGYGRLWYIQG